MNFSGAVLNGGISSRMGEDKATLSYKGERLIDVSLEALRQVGASEIFIVGGDSFVAEGSTNVGYCEDLYPGEGPLGGVISAIAHANTNTVIVLACDLLNLTSEVLQQCIETLGSQDVSFPTVLEINQVLCAAWRIEALPKLIESFDSGNRSLMGSLDYLDFNTFPLADSELVRGANTPDDLCS